MRALEAWRDARRRLAAEPDSEHLQAIVDYLQPLALRDYLAGFAADSFSTYDEEFSVSEEQAAAFLASLDELRSPSTRELGEIRREIHKQVMDATTHLLRLPWTGENTYDEAIADVCAVLSAVIDGKPWPVLERLRCPSEYSPTSRSTDVVRCQLQLPHDRDHQWQDAEGKGVSWTDEQALNPPKNYDEPTQNPDPINRPTQQYCGVSTEYSDAAKSMTLYCRKPKDHSGLHRAPSGETWEG